MEYSDEYWMQRALELAKKAEAQGEVPVGSVLIKDDQVIGEGWNHPVSANDPTAHAEISAMRAASDKLQNYRLPGTTLYVTLEPCTMCVGAMIHARIERLVFGAYEPKTGAVTSVFDILQSPEHNHCVNFQGGVLKNECAGLLKEFFQARRN
ncbi:MAG: tRNA adenosine(34) deaminase TadA [Gammaproteobacteria bacterium]|nr:tRNA adenosine(34) deaminase TadA [Gammaproteobacteria bacterium]